jgi:hypothetical protein
MAVGAVYRHLAEPIHSARALRVASALLPEAPLARALLGRHLLETRNLEQGAALYYARRQLHQLDLPLRYPAELLWDGRCGAGRSVLLWGGHELDECFQLIRLGLLLHTQGVRVGVDLPDVPLEIVRHTWPALDPARHAGQFETHYPLSDLLNLWRSPNPAVLAQVRLPVAQPSDAQPRARIAVGVAVDRSANPLTEDALKTAVRGFIGAHTVGLSPAAGWGLEGRGRTAEEQAETVLDEIANVDAVVTTSGLFAHVAGSAHKPVVYLAHSGRTWCWTPGRSVWYPRCYVVFSPAASAGNILPAVSTALSELLAK